MICKCSVSEDGWVSSAGTTISQILFGFMKMQDCNFIFPNKCGRTFISRGGGGGVCVFVCERDREREREIERK